MHTIVPLRESAKTPDDLGFLMHLMAVTDPDLHALALPGETGEERAARRAAAADIVDELAVEYRTEVGDTPVECISLDDYLTGGGDPWFEIEGRAA